MLMQDEYEKQRRIQENQGCRQRMVRKVSRLRVQKTKKTRNPGKSVQKSSPGGAPKHQTQDEEETAIRKISRYFGLQGNIRQANNKIEVQIRLRIPLWMKLWETNNKEKKPTMQRTKKEKKKREQKKKINNHKNKKILRTTSNNRQANNKIEVQNRLWIPL